MIVEIEALGKPMFGAYQYPSMSTERLHVLDRSVDVIMHASDKQFPDGGS